MFKRNTTKITPDENSGVEKTKKIKLVLLSLLFGLIFLLTCSIIALCIWYKINFNTTFAELLFTITSSMEGAGTGEVKECLSFCLPIVFLCIVLYVAAVLCIYFYAKKAKRLLFRIGAIFCAISLPLSSAVSLYSAGILEYFQNKNQTSDIYESYYVDPSSVEITSNGKTKNLIYIYLESMETTYASKKDGGKQTNDNYIQKLTDLACNVANISFSNTSDLGGFHSISGTGWTMGALLGTSAGIPFSLAVYGENSNNSLGKDGHYMDRVVTLGDILEEKGYTQEFLCGSNASFGGRKTYYQVHGNYEIYDLYTAQSNGDLPTSNYNDGWWGFEDFYLYEIAKKELLRLSSQEEPFNFTMLTVDTHHSYGHTCELCGNTYEASTGSPKNLRNILACADNQVYEFVEWIQQQSFYEDTVIIITGDHPRMDKGLIGDTEYYDRTIYNCFINASVSTTYTQNREFTSLDMFPTTLAAMGFQISGNRLALGTNMFSATKTLSEILGYEKFDEEVNKYSQYYVDNFK